MRWFHSAIDRLQEYTVVAPIQCPRGWGSVTFQTSVSASIMWIEIARKCPIAGLKSCAQCRPFNPDDVEGMRERLRKLDDLRVERVITEEEYELRRRRIIELREETQRSKEEGFHIAAWILAPIGFVLTIAGGLLAWRIHPGFLGIAGGGAVLLTLGLSFLYLSVPREPSP